MMKKIGFIFIAGAVCAACSTSGKQGTSSTGDRVIEERLPAVSQPMQMGSGIPVYTASNISYTRNGHRLLRIRFGGPVVIAVASAPEKWGFFQFPRIGRAPDNKLVTTWAMNPDAMEAYGTEAGMSATSADGGKTWQVDNHKAVIAETILPNGDRLAIETPKPVSVADLILPRPVGAAPENYRKSNFNFYLMRDLPRSCQGVFLQRLKKGENKWKSEQDSLYDRNATRYSLAGKIPVVWWGDMHVAKDGSLMAGIYPGNMVRDDGSFDSKNNIFFYRSTDNGASWQVQGRILYQPDSVLDPQAQKRMGMLEPGFEILKDGTFLCVIRTTDGNGLGPMYSSYSHDMGKTWSRPAVISANGVLPRLLQLDNGVVVLASGRPGVQLRFASRYDDAAWTQPFELLPYEHINETVSCGYTGLVATGKNSFIIVYSDFNYPTANGPRKAIKVREVTVTQP